MPYILHMVVPKANGLGCTAHAFAAHEGTIDGMPHFWYSTNQAKAITFATEAEAMAFNRKYMESGELSQPMELVKIS